MAGKNSTRLVVVESPTKAKTIRGFLPAGYRVAASMGHVRDLPESATDIPAKYKGQEWARQGVNVDADFEPLYIVPSKKAKIVGVREFGEGRIVEDRSVVVNGSG